MYFRCALLSVLLSCQYRHYVKGGKTNLEIEPLEANRSRVKPTNYMKTHADPTRDFWDYTPYGEERQYAFISPFPIAWIRPNNSVPAEAANRPTYHEDVFNRHGNELREVLMLPRESAELKSRMEDPKFYDKQNPYALSMYIAHLDAIYQAYNLKDEYLIVVEDDVSDFFAVTWPLEGGLQELALYAHLVDSEWDVVRLQWFDYDETSIIDMRIKWFAQARNISYDDQKNMRIPEEANEKTPGTRIQLLYPYIGGDGNAATLYSSRGIKKIVEAYSGSPAGDPGKPPKWKCLASDVCSFEKDHVCKLIVGNKSKGQRPCHSLVTTPPWMSYRVADLSDKETALILPNKKQRLQSVALAFQWNTELSELLTYGSAPLSHDILFTARCK